jgi:hypothetical protein
MLLYVHYIKTKDEQSLQEKLATKFIRNVFMEEYVNR